MKTTFLSTLHESDVACLLMAAKDLNIDKLIIIKPNAKDVYGNPLEGYVEVHTTEKNRDYIDLWNRYEFHHAWKDSDIETEIDILVYKFSKKIEKK